MESQIREWRRAVGALRLEPALGAELKRRMPPGRAAWVGVYEAAFAGSRERLIDMAIHHANSLVRRVAINILRQHPGADNPAKERAAALARVVTESNHFSDIARLIRMECKAELTTILQARFPARTNFYFLYVEDEALAQMTVTDQIRKLSLPYKAYLLKRAPHWFLQQVLVDDKFVSHSEGPTIWTRLVTLYRYRHPKLVRFADTHELMARLAAREGVKDPFNKLLDFNNEAALKLCKSEVPDCPTSLPMYRYADTLGAVVAQYIQMDSHSAFACARRLRSPQLASDFVCYLFALSEWCDPAMATFQAYKLHLAELSGIKSFEGEHTTDFNLPMMKFIRGTEVRRQMVNAIYQKLVIDKSSSHGDNLHGVQQICEWLTFGQAMHLVSQFQSAGDDNKRAISYMAFMAFWVNHPERTDRLQDMADHSAEQTTYLKMLNKVKEHGHKEAPNSRYHIERGLPHLLAVYAKRACDEGDERRQKAWFTIEAICILYRNCLQAKSCHFWHVWKDMVRELDRVLRVAHTALLPTDAREKVQCLATHCLMLLIDRMTGSEINHYTQDFFQPFVGLVYAAPMIRERICELINTQDLTPDSFWDVVPTALIDRDLFNQYVTLTGMQATRSATSWLRFIKACRKFEAAPELMFDVIAHASGALRNVMTPHLASTRMADYVVHEKVLKAKALSERRFWLKWLRRAVAFECKTESWFKQLPDSRGSQWMSEEVDDAMQLYWRRHYDSNAAQLLREWLEINGQDLTPEITISWFHLLLTAPQDARRSVVALLDRQLVAKPSSSKWALQLACQTLEQPAPFLLRCLTEPNIHLGTRARSIGMLRTYMSDEGVAAVVKRELLEADNKYFQESAESSALLHEHLSSWACVPGMRYDVLYGLLQRYVVPHNSSDVVQLLTNNPTLEDPDKILLSFVLSVATKPSQPRWVRPKAMLLLCRMYGDDVTFRADESGRQRVCLPTDADEYAFFCGFFPPAFKLASEHAEAFVDHVIEQLDKNRAYLIVQILKAYDPQRVDTMKQFCALLNYVLRRVRQDEEWVEILRELYLVEMPRYAEPDKTRPEDFVSHCGTAKPDESSVSARLKQTIWFSLLGRRERREVAEDPWGHPIHPTLRCCAHYLR